MGNAKTINQRFKIFDNFLKANKHTIERGDDSWQSDKIFFQLAMEHADNSPLSIDADKFESDKKVDWDYLRATSRADKMYLSPVVKQIDLGISNKVKFSEILSDGKILYSFENVNDMVVYDFKTDEKIILSGHKYPPSWAIEIDGIIISYDISYRSLIFYREYVAIHESCVESLKGISKLKNKIVMKFENSIKIVPIEELHFLEKNMEI